jgi:hypothetical protein
MVSDFFEFPEPEPPAPRQPRPAQPPWIQAPRGVLPGAIPLELLVASNEHAAVAISKLGAYPDGFDFELLVLVNEGEDELEPNVIGHPYRPGRHNRDAAREMLRFGIEFADGSRVTNIPGDSRHRSGDRDEPPPGPVMQQNGGGGGGGEWRQRFWVWPLPPAGPLAFACEWPAAGIEFTRVEVDARLLIDAATRSTRIFEDRGGGGASISITSTGNSLG